MIIAIDAKSRVMQCFLNSSAKSNFISQFLIKNAQLLENIVIDILIKTINNHVIRSYEQYIIDIVLIDNHEIREKQKYEFHVVNLRNYDIILKYS